VGKMKGRNAGRHMEGSREGKNRSLSRDKGMKRWLGVGFDRF